MLDSYPDAPNIYFSWQKSQWEKLNFDIENDRLPHAINLVGPSHVGKYQFAASFAQRILCLSSLDGHACGQCKACKLIFADNHPDLRRLEPDNKSKTLGVDSIRELGEFFAKTSQQGGWKVVIINPAESMNLNAANALLKNLEEPREKTLILLICHQPSRLLATIKSRCRLVRFPVPSLPEMRLWLSKNLAPREDIEELIQYASGSPLLAIKLTKTGLLESRRKFDRLLDDLATHKIPAISAAEVCKENDPHMALDWLYYKLVFEIRSGAKITSPVLSFRYMDRLIQSKKLVQSPANLNLLLIWEELLINWQQLFKKNK